MTEIKNLDLDEISANSIECYSLSIASFIESLKKIDPPVENINEIRNIVKESCRGDILHRIFNYLSEDNESGLQSKIASFKESILENTDQKSLLDDYINIFDIKNKKEEQINTIKSNANEKYDEKIKEAHRKSQSVFSADMFASLEKDLIVKNKNNYIEKRTSKIQINVEKDEVSKAFTLFIDKIIYSSLDLLSSVSKQVENLDITMPAIKETNQNILINDNHLINQHIKDGEVGVLNKNYLQERRVDFKDKKKEQKQKQ